MEGPGGVVGKGGKRRVKCFNGKLRMKIVRRLLLAVNAAPGQPTCGQIGCNTGHSNGARLCSRRFYAASIRVGSSSPTPALLTRFETIRSCSEASGGARRNSEPGSSSRIQAFASRQSRITGIRS